jgi:DNA-binding transcriptional LysR family regulator
MDTELLRAFVAVAETGSFSIAGDQLHLTQPAISKRISSLEQQLDTRLFDRIGRSVSLTESGRQLLQRAIPILRDIEDTRRAIRNLSGTVSGRLSLATSHHIGLHRLPPVLRSFSGNFPDVSLDIEFMDSEKAHEAVLHGDVELAVATLAPRCDPHLVASEVWPDPLVFVISREHRLARAESITLQALSECPVILPGTNTYTGQIIQQLFNRSGLSLDVLLSTNYLETIKMLVSIGLGWSVLPATMLDQQLTAVQPRGVKLTRSLGYIYHRNRTLSNAAKSFIELLDT